MYDDDVRRFEQMEAQQIKEDYKAMKSPEGLSVGFEFSNIKREQNIRHLKNRESNLERRVGEAKNPKKIKKNVRLLASIKQKLKNMGQ